MSDRVQQCQSYPSVRISFIQYLFWQIKCLCCCGWAAGKWFSPVGKRGEAVPGIRIRHHSLALITIIIMIFLIIRIVTCYLPILAFTPSPSSFLHLPLCLVSCPLGSCRWLLPPFPWTRKPPILRWGKGKLEKWTRVGSNRSIQCTLYTCTGNRGAPNQNKPIQNASCKLGFRI